MKTFGSLWKLSRLQRITPRKVLRRFVDFVQDCRCAPNAAFAYRLFPESGYSGHDALARLFGQVDVKDRDILVDVGCGLGRVIGFLSHRYPANRIIGIELRETAIRTQSAFAKNKNVEIRHADIRNCFPREGKVFYVFPPNGPEGLVILKILKELIDTHKMIGAVIVANHPGVRIDLFDEDASWRVQVVDPPTTWSGRCLSTYHIYRAHDQHPAYGTIFRKGSHVDKMVGAVTHV